MGMCDRRAAEMSRRELRAGEWGLTGCIGS